MSQQKLILVSMDAMIREDLDYLKTKPSFGWLLEHCAQVERVRSIYPTLTYPCHATMVTGCWPAKHGVVNNTYFRPGEVDPDWLWYHDVYQIPDLLDAAKAAYPYTIFHLCSQRRLDRGRDRPHAGQDRKRISGGLPADRHHTRAVGTGWCAEYFLAHGAGKRRQPLQRQCLLRHHPSASARPDHPPCG